MLVIVIVVEIVRVVWVGVYVVIVTMCMHPHAQREIMHHHWVESVLCIIIAILVIVTPWPRS